MLSSCIFIFSSPHFCTSPQPLSPFPLSSSHYFHRSSVSHPSPTLHFSSSLFSSLLSQYKSQIDQAAANEHLRDAHVWWSYVWHELKRQSTSHFPPGGGILDRSPGEFGTVSLFESDSQVQIVANKLRESLRSSAIMLASTRQVCVSVD